jgi:hypothetical protein
MMLDIQAQPAPYLPPRPNIVRYKGSLGLMLMGNFRPTRSQGPQGNQEFGLTMGLNSCGHETIRSTGQGKAQIPSEAASARTSSRQTLPM